MNTHFIFRAIVDSISDEMPEIPQDGIRGWMRNKLPRPCVDAIRTTKRVPSGSRNNMIYAVAVELRRRGWAESETLTECKAVNQKAFLQSLPAGEVARTVRSAYKKNYIQ